jgi:hypothetical protein
VFVSERKFGKEGANEVLEEKNSLTKQSASAKTYNRNCHICNKQKVSSTALNNRKRV